MLQYIKNVDHIVEFFSFGACMVLIFMLPISIAAVETTTVVLMVTFVIGLFSPKYRGKYANFLCSKEALFLLLFYLSLTMSFFSSGNLLGKSIEAWLLKWGEGIFLFCAAPLFLSRRKTQFLLFIFVISTLLVCVDGLSQKFLGFEFLRRHHLILTRNGVHGKVAKGICASLRHFNMFAAYLITSFFILVTTYMKHEKSRWAVFFIFIIGMLLTCLYFTYSRGAWLAFFLTNVIFLFSTRNKYVHWIVWGGIVLLIVPMLIMPLTQQRIILSGDNGRIGLWIKSLAALKQFPLQGFGLGLYMDFMGKNPAIGAQYAHNSYIQLLFETGIVGLTAFLWFLFYFFYQAFSYIRKSKDVLTKGICFGLLAFLVHAFFENHFFTVQLSILFWVLAGMVMGNMYEERTNEKAHSI